MGNIIGSVMKSGEEGQYDWGQTKKSSDDSIRGLKAELYRRLNEKKIPDEKAKIIQKTFRKRNNKTQKKEKKRIRSPSPSVSPDLELSVINSEFHNNEENMIKPIVSSKKASSEPTLTKLFAPSPTKKSRSANDLEAQVREDRADTPSKALAQEFNEKITFEDHHNQRQREQRGGNSDEDKIAHLTSQIADINKKIEDFNNKYEGKELIDTMENEKDQLLYQLQKLENEKDQLEKDLGNCNAKPYNDLIRKIRAARSSSNLGGKTKKKRKST